VSANAGRGWRAPSLFELYANGPHLGEARYELGDPDLVPEGSFELDAGLELRSARARGELTGFRNSIPHYIFVARDGTTRAVGTDTLDVYAYQQADARLVGGEFRGEFEATSSLTLRGRADYVSGANLDLEQPLPLIPPLRAAIEAEIHSSKLSWAERANAGIETEYVADQNRLGAFDMATGSYALVHLEAGMSKRLGQRSYRFDLRVKNALNTSYRDFLSRYKKFALDQGRNVMLMVSTGL
jgi:outer membrane receptor protein involved in Fe transport